MTVFFTSDEHYFHLKINELCGRPFVPAEMNDELISKFNKKVKPEDLTYHLGDFTLGKQPGALTVLNQLNGLHLFVKGNHDSWLKEPIKNQKIINVVDYLEISLENQKIVMSHFPMLSWHHSYRGTFMLHGHCHSKINAQNVGVRRLDVGVDSASKILGDFVPFSFAEVNDLLKDNPSLSI